MSEPVNRRTQPLRACKIVQSYAEAQTEEDEAEDEEEQEEEELTSTSESSPISDNWDNEPATSSTSNQRIEMDANVDGAFANFEGNEESEGIKHVLGGKGRVAKTKKRIQTSLPCC